MKTTTAISPIMKNVLSIPKIQPMAMKATQMARIAPRIVHIIRPIYQVCARRPPQVAVVVTGPARAPAWRGGSHPCATAPRGAESPRCDSAIRPRHRYGARSSHR